MPAWNDVERRGPLAGVKVVETAIYMAGPYAGMMLADLGADVVKIESAKGDPFRKYGRPKTPFSAVFANCNRSKRSVVLDLKDPAGREALLELLADERRLPRQLAGRRRRVTRVVRRRARGREPAPRALLRHRVRPRRPARGRASVRHRVARAKRVDRRHHAPGHDPTLIPGYPVDKLVAMMAVQAILASLFERGNTGIGDRIEVPMLDVNSYINFADLFTNRVFVDHQPEVAQNLQLTGIRPVRALDGWIVCAPVTSPQIAATFDALGHPEWTDEVLRLPDQPAIVKAMFDTVERATAALTVEEVLACFRVADVPAAKCITMDEHFDDPQVQHSELYRIEEWPGCGRVRTVRYPGDVRQLGPRLR